METIRYSLNAEYSIDLGVALKYSQSDPTNKLWENQTLGDNKKLEVDEKLHDSTDGPGRSNDKTCIFDQYCSEIYGNRTCIFFEIHKDTFQQRFLDGSHSSNVYRNQFYTKIPELVEDSYTVVIVEMIEDRCEIVAIHSPSN